MKNILIILALSFFALNIQAQGKIENQQISELSGNKLERNKNPYKVKIRHMNGKYTVGYAYLISDDKISVLNPYIDAVDSSKIQTRNMGSITQYPASGIKKITFREKNRFRNNILGGFLLGALSGLAFGAIKSEGIAIPIGDLFVLDFTHPYVPVNYTRIVLHGAAAGVVLGAINGSVSQSFRLKGKKERFYKDREKMNKYMLAYQQAPAF